MVELKKRSKEKVDDYYTRLLNEKYELKDSYQGISISNIEFILNRIDYYSDDIRDAIWCLLNNELPSLFPNSDGYTISDGASTAHIGGYIGILMRKRGRLDREGRDYWIKPLTEIGAIQKFTYDSKKKTFVPDHIRAKSPHSAYKLDPLFIDLLSNITSENFEDLLNKWISKSIIKMKLKIQSEAKKYEAKIKQDNPHHQLIKDSIDLYAKNFIPTYEPIHTDAFDGERITEQDQFILRECGISIDLDDVWPDVVLVDKENESLWFIEAVTSDGEVDEQKMSGLKKICKKSNKSFGGATTTYETWNELARRQKKNRNLAKDSYIWVREDPGRHLKTIN